MRKTIGVLSASSRHNKEAVPMNSEQYGGLNKACTMASADMTMRIGKSNKAPPQMKSYRQSMITKRTSLHMVEPPEIMAALNTYT